VKIKVADGDAPAAVYRLYADGTLLYVGVTDSPSRRLKTHAREMHWWPDVTEKTVTWYNGRVEAEAAETAAIDGEDPVYNIYGTPRHAETIREALARRAEGITEHQADQPGICAVATGRAVDDPASLARAARIVRIALERRVLPMHARKCGLCGVQQVAETDDPDVTVLCSDCAAPLPGVACLQLPMHVPCPHGGD
jgi:hypothetical protein